MLRTARGEATAVEWKHSRSLTVREPLGGIFVHDAIDGETHVRGNRWKVEVVAFKCECFDFDHPARPYFGNC